MIKTSRNERHDSHVKYRCTDLIVSKNLIKMYQTRIIKREFCF